MHPRTIKEEIVASYTKPLRHSDDREEVQEEWMVRRWLREVQAGRRTRLDLRDYAWSVDVSRLIRTVLACFPVHALLTDHRPREYTEIWSEQHVPMRGDVEDLDADADMESEDIVDDHMLYGRTWIPYELLSASLEHDFLCDLDILRLVSAFLGRRTPLEDRILSESRLSSIRPPQLSHFTLRGCLQYDDAASSNVTELLEACRTTLTELDCEDGVSWNHYNCYGEEHLSEFLSGISDLAALKAFRFQFNPNTRDAEQEHPLAPLLSVLTARHASTLLDVRLEYATDGELCTLTQLSSLQHLCLQRLLPPPVLSARLEDYCPPWTVPLSKLTHLIAFRVDSIHDHPRALLDRVVSCFLVDCVASHRPPLERLVFDFQSFSLELCGALLDHPTLTSLSIRGDDCKHQTAKMPRTL